MPCLPGASAQLSGGIDSGGCASLANDTDEKFWSRRTIMKDASLYANWSARAISTVSIVRMRGIMYTADLLTQADPWSCVEGYEDEGFWGKVLLDPGVDKPVRVEFESW